MESKLKYYLEIADNAQILARQLRNNSCEAFPDFETLIEEEYILGLEELATQIYVQASKIPIESAIEVSIWLAQRKADEFYNCLLVEIKTSDCYEILVRQLFFDTFNYLHLLETTRSDDPFLSELSQNKLGNFNKHMLKVQKRILQIGSSNSEITMKIQEAILNLWKYAPDLFQASSADIFMLSRGKGINLSALKTSWEENLSTLLRQINVVIPRIEKITLIGKEGQHTEDLVRLIKKSN